MNTLYKTLKSLLAVKYVPVRTATFLGYISLTACATAETPDLSGFWTIRYQQSELAAPAQKLLDSLPDNSVFVDDAGAGELGEGEYSGLTLSEQALNEVNDYNPEDELSIEASCIPPSVTFYMQAPFPIEIYQGKDMIVFKIEYYDMFRVIFMDGREHPPVDAPHSKNGHSIGHWDGDELVVDTSHISSATFMNNGFSHSDDIHMVERFKLSDDGSTLWSTEVFDDPEIFTGLAARYVSWSKVPDQYVYPYECNPSFWQ